MVSVKRFARKEKGVRDVYKMEEWGLSGSLGGKQ